MAILLTTLRDFVRHRPERREVPWGIGCTPRALAPEWAEPEDPLVVCLRNGGRVTDWDALLVDGDHLHFGVRPGFDSGGTLTALLGGLSGSTIYNLLISKKDKPSKPGDESSATYSFSPTTNRREEGTPIPVVYGQHLVTPPLINEYIASSIDANGNPVSEYRALYLLSEGPISKVGNKSADGGPFRYEDGTGLDGLEINGQPAKNFSGVEAHVRLGNLDQAPILEISDPVLTSLVDKTLRDTQLPSESATGLTHATTPSDTPSATTAIATAGSSGGVGDPTGTNVTKWNTAGPGGAQAHESFTAGDEADEFTVVLEFPNGLISYNATSGAAQSNFVIYQIRYRQVDGGGTPFGDYVILPAEIRTLTREGLLRLESRHKFFLPSSYQAPSLGFYATSRATGTGNPGISYAAVDPSFVPAVPAALQFSFSTWIRRRNAQGANTTNRIFQWFDTPGNEGIRLDLIDTAGIKSLRVGLGTGAGVTNVTFGVVDSLLGTDATNSHHLVLTYEANFDGTNTRLRYYLDGVLKATQISSAQATLDSTQAIRLMSDSLTPTLGYDGRMDETTFWSRALTPYEIASIYNGPPGNASAARPSGVDAAADGLIIGARFDDNPATGQTTAFGPYAVAGTPWILGSGTNAATDPDISGVGDPNEGSTSAGNGLGKVLTPEIGTTLKSRYLVEVLRLDLEDVSQLARSEMKWATIQLRQFQDYEYPGLALLYVSIPANDQLSGGAPTVRQRIDGRLVPVWDGANAVYPNLVPTYSRNPAWVAVDAAMNKDFGLGSAYQKASDIDVVQFAAAAAVWDTKIYDNLGRLAFSIAEYRDDSEEILFAFDSVRYTTATLPAGLTVGSNSGKFLKPILTGLSPAPPAWLTTQAGLAAQEVFFVKTAGSLFQIYTQTTQTLGAGQAAYNVSSGQTVDNGLEFQDVRARFDGVFDRADLPAWDAIVQILSTARGAPMRLGSRLSVFYDDVAAPTALITHGNIVAGSWRHGYMGVSDRPNAESGDIFDESLNWERAPIEDEHPDVTDPTKAGSFRWRRVQLEGIARRGQAKRYLRRDLNIYNLVRRWCEFETGIDGIPILPGEVVAVSSDVPQWGFSGRMYGAGTNTTVKLDRRIVLAAATSYQIQVQDTASGNRYTVAVSSGAGTYVAGSTITVAAFPSSFAPAKDDLYAIGPVSAGETKKFRVVERAFDPKLFRVRFKCVEYDAQVYDDDFGTLPAASSSLLPVPGVPVVPPGVENLTVTEQTSRGPDGTVRLHAQVTFSHFSATYSSVGGADVYLGVGGHEAGLAGAELATRLDAQSTAVTLTYPFQRNQRYTVWVVARARDGSTNYRAFATWQEFTPTGLAPTPLKPANVRAAVAGELVTYSWDDPGDGDMGATVEARQGGWILGLPLFVAPAQGRNSPPLSVWNSSPTNALGVAETPIYLRTKLGTGQYSDVATLQFAPTLPSADGNVLERNEEDGSWT